MSQRLEFGIPLTRPERIFGSAGDRARQGCQDEGQEDERLSAITVWAESPAWLSNGPR
jgi:hypothetical protein